MTPSDRYGHFHNVRPHDFDKTFGMNREAR